MFDILHSYVWTYPLLSHIGSKYYVNFLDQYSHYVLVYPLKQKYEVFDKFVHFYVYVCTHFNCEIKIFQCDNGEGANDSVWINTVIKS